MTKEEALVKIKELEDYIKELDTKVGFEDDEIFLLSAEEYRKYKDDIPHFNTWWWLRSPGNYSTYTACVLSDGSVRCNGNYVDTDDGCVRPALHIKSNNLQIGCRIIKYDFPWIVIDKDLVVAEVPIAAYRFDIGVNNYATSEIRQFLKDWLDERRGD